MIKSFYLSFVHNLDAMKCVVKSCDDAFRDKIFARKSFAELLTKWYIAGDMVCARTNTVKGYAVLYSNDCQAKRAYIPMIGVRPKYQKQGCGKALLEECESIAQGKMMKSIALEVQKSNLNAIEFYLHMGYHEVMSMNRSYIYEKDLTLK